MALNDFNLFRIDRESRGGGVTIYVRVTIQATLLTAVSREKYIEYKIKRCQQLWHTQIRQNIYFLVRFMFFLLIMVF